MCVDLWNRCEISKKQEIIWLKIETLNVELNVELETNVELNVELYGI